MEDAELVRRVTAGDREAFAAIYDRYAPAIHDFLASMTRNPNDAADLVQDTFLVAGERLHQLRDPDRLRPWLYAIARNAAMGVLGRRSRRREEPLDHHDPPTSPDGDRGLDADDAATVVWAAAAGLAERDRALLDLHLRQGLEGEELGLAMGVSAEHAHVLLHRLRAQLERSIGAVLIARQGRPECRDLASILSGWDGRFSPLLRKRVARHCDGCPDCGERRSKMASPFALLSAIPVLALPGQLRDRVLGDVQLVSSSKALWPGDGFPPGISAGRRRWPAAGAAAAVALLVGTAGLSAWMRPSEVQPATSPVALPLTGNAAKEGPSATPLSQRAAEAGDTPVEAAIRRTTEEVRPTGTTEIVKAEPTGGGAAETEEPGEDRSGDGSAGKVSPGTSRPAPAPPDPGRGDTSGPEISGVSLSARTVRPAGRCSNTTDPDRSELTFSVSDPGGIASVEVLPGVTAIRERSDYYKSVLGPFEEDGTLNFTIRARDGAGNVASRSVNLLSRCEPLPAVTRGLVSETTTTTTARRRLTVPSTTTSPKPRREGR